MSLDVAPAVLPRGLGMAAKRRADRADAPAKKPRADDHAARAVRLASATQTGVATVVPPDQRVDKDYLDADGFRQPLLVRAPAQLDLVVPAQGAMTLAELEAAIGPEHAVRAIDVASQRELASEMKLKEWMQYFGQTPEQRERVLNLISLECTGTKLDALVRPPKVLREIGWVEKHWAAAGAKTAMGRKELALKPKVRLYCLMSAAGSYTESHVDFGGSSVWYHLYKGRKFFFVIPPTDANLDRFAQWEAEYQHGKAPFFGDLVPPGDCTVLEMRAGDTMMLPSGWIHAVYTPEDSISFGGNFLSGYHMATHLRCHAKEKRQQIEGRFFFPEFECTVWYAAAHYAKMLSTCPYVLSKWELQGLRVLLEVLRDWLAGKTHGIAGTPDPAILDRVNWICKTTAHCDPSVMLEKMVPIVQTRTAQTKVEDASSKSAACTSAIKTEKMSPSGLHTQQEHATTNLHVLEVQVSAMDDPRDAISRITSDDSSSSSSSSNESSSDSSDSSSVESSDGEDTGKESDKEPPAAGDDDNDDTNESSSDSSSDDDSSSSSSSDNEDEPIKEPEDEKEPLKDEVEEFDEPEESSSSDSDNDMDPESAYPDLPPIPVDALIAIRKRAKLKELQITKQGKEQVIAMARQHLIERQRSARSKKKKAASVGGSAVTVVTPWGEDEHWVVACSCGLGGQDYDDGREMVECNNCKNWVHIDCVRIPVHDIFWCFKCRASDEWLFVCKCGVQEKNFDDGVRMVQCEVCEAWEHTRCGGVNDLEEPPEVYECTRCRKVRKKARPTSASQKKRNSKSKSGRGGASTKQKKDVLGIVGTLAPLVPIVPPLPLPPTVSSSPPPPPPPPPSAPPSPSSLPDEDYVPSVGKYTIQPDGTPSPVQKRKRGRPPLGKSKGKKVRHYDEDYRDSVDALDTAATVSGTSAMMRPPLPITSKSATAPTKRKSGGSARDRLEKKLKTRKPRG